MSSKSGTIAIHASKIYILVSCILHKVKIYCFADRYCNRVWLKSVEKRARFRCCFLGKACDIDTLWPKLNPLQTEVIQMLLGKHCIEVKDPVSKLINVAHSTENNIAHFSRNSARYNGIFSISATGVDNGKGGGWEKLSGNHGGIILSH